MKTEPTAASGLLDRLLRIGALLIANAQDSVEHWAGELRAEERRILLTMVWVGITFLFGAMTCLLLTALALALLPAHLLIAGLAALTGLYLAGFIILAFSLRRRLARPVRLPVTSGVVFAAQVLTALPRFLRHKRNHPADG